MHYMLRMAYTRCPSPMKASCIYTYSLRQAFGQSEVRTSSRPMPVARIAGVVDRREHMDNKT